MGYICTRCGGTNVACEAIVNPNTLEIIDYLSDVFMHATCSDCEEMVTITNPDQIKRDIELKHSRFVEKNGKEPEYAWCQVVWKDTGENKRTIIKLSTTIVDDDEEDVFYYCNGIESLKSLTEYTPDHTFIMTDCWSFF